MLTLHHLNDSRSQRILWLLEELGTPYEMKRYQRNTTTRLAPPELEAVHPLGKSPVITDGDVRIAESGAIVDYIIRRYGKGALMPAQGTADYETYNEWLHYSEGSAMLPLMLNLYVGRLKGNDLLYAGKVDHGFDTASAKDLQARLKPLIRKTQPYTKKIAHRGVLVEPSLLAEIEYRAKSAEGKVRHPFFKGLREDL